MEGKDLKRRLVQSTLFPHKDSTTKADESGGGDREEEKVAEEEEDEDWRGSSKKRRMTQKKGNSKLKGKQGASLKEMRGSKLQNRVSALPPTVQAGTFSQGVNNAM